MRRVLIGFVLLALTGLAVAYSQGLLNFGIGVHAGSCAENDEIPSDQRRAVESQALAFVESGLTSEASKAYAMMTANGQTLAPIDKLQSLFDMLGKITAPLGPRHVSRTYFIRDTGAGSNGTTVCGTLSGNNWVAVQTKAGTNQAYVVITAKSRNNDWAFTVWLLPNGSGWQIESFNANAATIVGLGPDELLQKARTERDAGHIFNATMLYQGALGISSYGPSFQLGVAQPLREELGKLPPLTELTGKPPFTWSFEGKAYSVQQVGIIGVAGQIGLMFALHEAEWPDDATIDRSNRDFINGFIATHPDYSRSFSFLVARAYKPDNSGGLGTVFQNGKGFD